MQVIQRVHTDNYLPPGSDTPKLRLRLAQRTAIFHVFYSERVSIEHDALHCKYHDLFNIFSIVIVKCQRN